MAMTSQASSSTSTRTEEALKHLKSIKPLDGWSVDVYLSSNGEKQNVLCRRKVPLTEESFADIYYDWNGSKCVVGLKAATTNNERIAIVLVEANGTVARPNREIQVVVSAATTSQSTDTNFNTEPRTNTTRINNNNNNNSTLTDEENKRILLLALYVVILSVTMKLVLSSALSGLLLVILPLLLFYASQTVPSNDCFDAKKELKRVLRGEHLAIDHPEKPKTWLEQTLARVQASVATEVATGLLGYEVSMTNIMGLATVASVRVPMAKLDCYWLGVFGKWYYITTREYDTATAQQVR